MLKKPFGLVLTQKIKRLTVREENELIRRKERGNLIARDQLVIHNIPLVISITKRYVDSTHIFDDLFSLGTLALLRCIDDFNTTKRCRLSTYATQRITAYIINYGILKNRRDIPLEFDIITEPKVDDWIDRDYVKHLLTLLTQRERKLVCMYFGIGTEPSSFVTCAKALNISSVRAGKILKKAIEFLKQYAKKDDNT